MATQLMSSGEKFRQAIRLLREGVGGKTTELFTGIRNTVSLGQKKVTYAAMAVNDSVHRKPWRYVAGCGVSAITIGYLLGKRK